MAKRKKKVIAVTWDIIQEKLDELIKTIKLFENSQADAAVNCAFELINLFGDSHYSSLGMASELLLRYREIATEVMADEIEERKELEDITEEFLKNNKPN